MAIPVDHLHSALNSRPPGGCFVHQANALIVGPGGYKVRDFLRVGSLVTLLYLAVLLPLLCLLY